MVEIDEKYCDYADELTPCGMAVRCPSGLGLEERYAKATLEHADELLGWAKARCTKLESGESEHFACDVQCQLGRAYGSHP